MVLALGKPLEGDGHVPPAHDAFDHGMLNRELRRVIEAAGQPGVSELECARHLQGQRQRVDAVASALQRTPPERFRPVPGRCRNGETKGCWAFPKVGRLQRSGRKRLVIGHAREDRGAAPRFVRTDALQGDRGRVIATWSERWASEIFQEFGTQVAGLEAAQVRQEDAVKRHVRLRCGAQSLLQQAPASGSEAERFAFAQGDSTIGQKVRTRAREA
jgi:hypothetical protein